MIDLHAVGTQVVIEHNDIGDAPDLAPLPGCYGVALSNATGARIARNEIGGIGAHLIDLVDSKDCVIENNLLMTWRNMGVTPVAIAGSTGTNVRSNTIHFGDGSGSDTELSTAIDFSYTTTPDTTQISNNLIIYDSSRPNFSCFSGLRPDPPNFSHMDGNECYFPNLGIVDWVSGHGTVADWREVAPAGTDEYSYCCLDPGLDGALEPKPNAFVIGKGDATNYPSVDLIGHPRHNPPDIGAFEHQ